MELLPSLLAGLRTVCVGFPDARKGRRGNIATADFGLSTTRRARAYTALLSGANLVTRQKAPLTLAIVGNSGGTNVGESLRRAAISMGHAVLFFDTLEAWGGSRLLRALSWRFADRRPPRLGRIAAKVISGCSTAQPQVLIATGAAPLTQQVLRKLRSLGVLCINYSTDDPWNPALFASWHLRALPAYDIVFTPRHANIADFHRLGCANVHFLPFGYDHTLFGPVELTASIPQCDVLFVGGADRDRVAFMQDFISTGPRPALIGNYWERYRATRPYALGHKPATVLRDLTASAKVNLCLVRRANRDGHVMRSFEIAAIGGCMLAEDTEEHRTIFGGDGDSVRYFRTPKQAAALARVLIADPTERARLAASVRACVDRGAHTYYDRLCTILGYTTLAS
jgi:spore maturation protein CgeB